MSSRKSLSTKFTQAASKKQQNKSKLSKKPIAAKTEDTNQSDKRSLEIETTAGEAKSQEKLTPNKKVETETVVQLQKALKIIQSIPTEVKGDDGNQPTKDSERKLSEGIHLDSKELLRPIFRLGSHEGSQDGDEGDHVFELKRRTSSVSSHGRQDSLPEDYEDMSLSSSGFSPGSTSASLKSFEGRNRIDDFSDDSDSNKLRESAELSDDMEVAGFNAPCPVPYNRQLRIVTSLDPGLRLPKHDRRSSSPGGFESTGILRRKSLIFADFLSKRSLSIHLNHFPSDMTIEKFR